MGKSTEIALALGSNLGDRQQALRAALAKLEGLARVTAVSPFYETAPAYVMDQPAFLNAALIGETSLPPRALLTALKNLETQMGRVPAPRFGPRVIDLDIIFYGDAVVREEGLHIPHPRLAEREFVLRPLADIAPQWKHPETGCTVAEMLEAL